jgi:hypothetical protein
MPSFTGYNRRAEVGDQRDNALRLWFLLNARTTLVNRRHPSVNEGGGYPTPFTESVRRTSLDAVCALAIASISHPLPEPLSSAEILAAFSV